MPTHLAVTRIAHSCLLVEIGDDTFLTDPWFSDRPPIYQAGERRSHRASELPVLTGVVVSHAHGDHCDLAPLVESDDRGVSVVGDATVAARARAAGITSFSSPKPWTDTTLGDTTITAIPARHKVPETTFLLRQGDVSVFFAGDTLYLQEHDEIPRRYGAVTLALLPTNGLRIRPLLNRKVVMDADDAARLTAALDADVAVPHHYAFTSGPWGDRLLTRKDRDPENYRRAAAQLAPRTDVRILPTGERSVVSRVDAG